MNKICIEFTRFAALTGALTMGVMSFSKSVQAAQNKSKQKSVKPNIIYYLVDDFGAECPGVYGGGTYQTPNINALSEQGILYQNAHAMPLSCPSRVQTMTGKYNYKNYVAFGYINPDEKTFAHLAKEAGYATAMVGKWQLGRSREVPGLLGFDEWCLNQLLIYKEFTKDGGTDRYASSYVDNNGRLDLSIYGPDDIQQYAFRFIDRQHKAGKPFLLYYTTPLVHTPFTPTPDTESWDLDVLGRGKSDVKHFPDMVKYMDKQLGQLVAKLKKDGLWENTIIVFTADNGTTTKTKSVMKDGRVIQGGKGTTTEYGTHVPLIVTWGDKIKEARVSDRLVDMTDFLPSFADAMGVNVPVDWDIDGISLYPEWCGQKAKDRAYAICHFNPCWPTTPTANAARLARTVRYKLYEDGRLIDAMNDPLDKNPIPNGQGSKEAEAARKYLQSILDKLPAWTPEKGMPRKGDYGTFYDFAGPQNPF